MELVRALRAIGLLTLPSLFLWAKGRGQSVKIFFIVLLLKSAVATLPFYDLPYVAAIDLDEIHTGREFCHIHLGLVVIFCLGVHCTA